MQFPRSHIPVLSHWHTSQRKGRSFLRVWISPTKSHHLWLSLWEREGMQFKLCGHSCPPLSASLQPPQVGRCPLASHFISPSSWEPFKNTAPHHTGWVCLITGMFSDCKQTILFLLRTQLPSCWDDFWDDPHGAKPHDSGLRDEWYCVATRTLGGWGDFYSLQRPWQSPSWMFWFRSCLSPIPFSN